MIFWAKFLGAAGLLALLFGGQQQAAEEQPEDKGEPKGEPPFAADPAREQLECQKIADEDNKPIEWEGRTRAVGQTLSAWLGWVAYRRAYPAGPADPTSLDWVAARDRITACVKIRLTQGGGGINLPKDPDKPPDLPVVVTKPTEDAFYQIQAGDTLLGPNGVVARAYGTSGAANLAAAMEVNSYAFNQRFWTPAPAGEQKWWAKRISFLPNFGTWAQQFADATKGAAGQGNSFPVVYLPPKSQVVK